MQYTIFMNKKYLLPIILIVFLLIIFTLYFLKVGSFPFLFKQNPFNAAQQEESSEIPKDYLKVTGILRTVGNNGEEIGTENNLYGYNAQFQIIRSGDEPYSLDKFVIGQFSSDSAEKTYNDLTLADTGKCVEAVVSSISETAPGADNYNNLKIITVDKLTIIDTLSCYDDNPDLYPSQQPLLDQPMVNINTIVTAANRPAHDIGYDYEITILWSEAQAKGYIDSTGYKYAPTDQITIFMTVDSLEMAKKIELAKRSTTAVNLKGQFQWGYAENNVFKINAVEF